MANYAVDDHTESASTLTACLALLEAKLETITNTKKTCFCRFVINIY